MPSAGGAAYRFVCGVAGIQFYKIVSDYSLDDDTVTAHPCDYDGGNVDTETTVTCYIESPWANSINMPKRDAKIKANDIVAGLPHMKPDIQYKKFHLSQIKLIMSHIKLQMPYFKLQSLYWKLEIRYLYLGTLTKPHDLPDSSPADQEATNDEKRQMNIISLFIANPKAALIEQPIECGFHHIVEPTQAAAVFGVSLGDQRRNAPLTQRLANLFFSVIGPIRQHLIGPSLGPTSWLTDRRNRIDQRDGHFRIVDVCAGVFDGQRNPTGLNDQVTLTAVFAPIRGVRTGLRPPKSARTEQLSIAVVDKSGAVAQLLTLTTR